MAFVWVMDLVPDHDMTIMASKSHQIFIKVGSWTKVVTMCMTNAKNPSNRVTTLGCDRFKLVMHICHKLRP